MTQRALLGYWILVGTFLWLPTTRAQLFTAHQLLQHPAMHTVALHTTSRQTLHYQAIRLQQLLPSPTPHRLVLYLRTNDTLRLSWHSLQQSQLLLLCIRPLDRRARHDTLQLQFNHQDTLSLNLFIAEFNRAVVEDIHLPIFQFPLCLTNAPGMWLLQVTAEGTIHCYAQIQSFEFREVQQTSEEQ